MMPMGATRSAANFAARIYGGIVYACSLCLMFFAAMLAQTHAAAAAIVPFSAGLIFAALSIPIWRGHAWAAISMLETMVALATLAAFDDPRYLWIGVPISALFGMLSALMLWGRVELASGPIVRGTIAELYAAAAFIYGALLAWVSPQYFPSASVRR
jgi:hypothetical protein